MTARAILSILVWVCCLPAMAAHLGLALSDDRSSGLLLISLLAWPVLLRMNVNWLTGRPLHWVWPVGGTIAAVIWLIPLGYGSLVVLAQVVPGVVMAIFLVQWHLRHRYASQARN